MNPQQEVDNICAWIKEYAENAGAKGIVIGLSGGIDSALVLCLCVEALGKDKVKAVLLPANTDALAMVERGRIGYTSTSKDNFEHNVANSADMVAWAELPTIALGNAKSRMRMLCLYAVANSHNYLVAGTSNKTELAIGYFCYDEQTRAWTKEGFKSYKDLREGDVTLSIDPETGEVVESGIEEINVFDYDDELYSYGGEKGQSKDLMITPNHRILIEKNDKIEFCRADELPRRNTPMPLHKPWTRGVGSTDAIFKFDNKDVAKNGHVFQDIPMSDFMYLIGLYVGDGSLNCYRTQHNIKGTGPSRDTKTGQFVESNIPTHQQEYTGYKTCFSLPEGYTEREKLTSVLSSNNIPYSLDKNNVYISGKPFYKEFEECGTSAHTKSIPQWLLDYSIHHLEFLLEGLMDSDGHTKSGYYYTVSKRLVEQITELATKLGRHVLIREREPRQSTMKDGTVINSSRSYEVSIGNTRKRWINAAKFKKVPYKGKVWCPSIPGYENFLVERNGKLLFCGNTKYGDGGADFEPIGNYHKSEVYEMAKLFKDAIPENIFEKAPSADLWEGQTDENDFKEKLGIDSYAQLEGMLVSIEKGHPLGNPQKVYAYINKNRHKMEMPPVCPRLPEEEEE